MTNIFISNLSFRVTNEDLKKIFDDYGEVTSAKVITDGYTGRSRGFGFVEMTSDEEATKAIDELNQAEFDGKVINVSVARPKTERREGGNRGNHFGGGNRGGGDGQRYNKRY
ncbi:MAG: RNA-binding protein [Bacteroidota bacterium]|nr:RNA-binding protein [Bacteroidota bacterium]